MADPHIVTPGHAPTPFTAAEIRGGCPAGRTIRLLVEPAGEPPFVREIRFLTSTEEWAEQSSDRLALDGTVVEHGEPERVGWDRLQAHASFPREAVAITSESVTIHAGEFACLLYVVTDDESVSRYWFARDLPGMPVKVETRVADAVVFTMTMLENVIRPD